MKTCPANGSARSTWATCRQPVEPVAHADRAAGQIDFGAGGDLDHDVAFNTANTRRNARSLTKASTRSRVPSARSISITPGRSSIAGCRGAAPPDGAGETGAGEAPAISAGPSSCARANMPIGTKSATPVTYGDAAAGKHTAIGAISAAVEVAFRQLNTWLAFSP